MAKPKAKLIPIITTIERMSAPILLPTIASAPNKPKIAPDAPTDALYKDAK